MWTFVWLVTTIFNGHDGLEPTDRLVPPGWQGNPWGPAATRRGRPAQLPPIAMTPIMKQWDRWGRKVLRDGDIVFRRADARILLGRFPFSRFTARVSGSEFSHTGIVAVEQGEPVVYDTTKAGVRRQPFAVWVLDNVGPLGVKRPRPELASHIPGVLRFCRDAFEKQVPFDFDLNPDDTALYCVEMTEKAYRAGGLRLSEPVRLGDMENVTKYPICVFLFLKLSKLTLDQPVYFPGNERHGIWSSPNLMTVYPPPSSSPSAGKPHGATAARTASRDGPNPR